MSEFAMCGNLGNVGEQETKITVLKANDTFKKGGCYMNYIAEIRAFYDWLQFNSIPSGAQALWHVLMQLNNKCAVKKNDAWYWRVEFTVTNKTLLSILAFSVKQLHLMRNVLIQNGRIMYKKGKGNESGTYQMIPFECNNYTQMSIQTGTQMGMQVWIQTSLNSTTLINNNNNYNININKSSSSSSYYNGDSDSEENELSFFGKNKNLLLTENQIGDLIDKLGLDAFDYYTDKLSVFIAKSDASVKNHYATILKWHKEDTAIGKGI